MTDTDRIIEVLRDRGRGIIEQPRLLVRESDLATLVNLAMSGVCPECNRTDYPTMLAHDEPYDGPCPNPYHDNREALDALIAERG